MQDWVSKDKKTDEQNQIIECTLNEKDPVESKKDWVTWENMSLCNPKQTHFPLLSSVRHACRESGLFPSFPAPANTRSPWVSDALPSVCPTLVWFCSWQTPTQCAHLRLQNSTELPPHWESGMCCGYSWPRFLVHSLLKPKLPEDCQDQSCPMTIHAVATAAAAEPWGCCQIEQDK